MKLALEHTIYCDIKVLTIISPNNEAKQLDYNIRLKNISPDMCLDPEGLKQIAKELNAIADELLSKEQMTKTFLLENI